MRSADSTDALVALSPELGEDEIFIVLTWGAQLGYAANQELLGTAEDLDMYVSFLADAESDERCLLYYGVTSCGDAKLVRSDQLTVPSSVTSVIAEADEYGAESIRSTSLRATTYTVFIRNSGLEQPTERAEIKVDVFNVDGLVSRVDPPAACDATDNTTARELCGDDYDSPLFVDPGSDKKTPVWSTSESNREQAEWYRALCIDNAGDAPVVSEVQRYFTSSAWAYAQVIDGCPPVERMMATGTARLISVVASTRARKVSLRSCIVPTEVRASRLKQHSPSTKTHAATCADERGASVISICEPTVDYLPTGCGLAFAFFQQRIRGRK